MCSESYILLILKRSFKYFKNVQNVFIVFLLKSSAVAVDIVMVLMLSFILLLQIDMLRRNVTADEMKIKMSNAAKAELKKQIKDKSVK